jgi:predicted membrane protein
MMYQVPIQIPETLQAETVNAITITEAIGAVAVFGVGFLIARLAQRGVRKAV